MPSVFPNDKVASSFAQRQSSQKFVQQTINDTDEAGENMTSEGANVMSDDSD